MTKTRVLSLAALLAALLFLLALPASAQCDPTSDPSCRLSPLQSRQVNPAASAAEGETTDLSAPGVPAPAAAVAMPLITADSLSGVGASVASSEHRAPSGRQQARRSALGASAVASAAPSIEALNLRMRYQDPSDVSCGVQALGMALDGLRAEGLEAPSSSALVGFLQNQGMIYDFGTGVEELAYAAGSFGFKGSQPFHGWTIEDLRPELVGGRPVVVALGSNGEGVPGHFVTVTGFSADGKWVSYNDPTLGKVTQSVDDFEALWAAQGHSGVSVQSPAALPADTPDNLPLLALLAGVMALVSATPLGKFRLGVGGKIVQGSGGANSSAPPYPAPAGTRWRAKTVPVYNTKSVQEGWTTVSRRVPIKKSVREQVGTRTYYEKIPQFKTIKVRDGYRWVAHKVPKYKTVRYVRYYRYRTQRRPTPWGWSYYRKRVPVYGSRRVGVGTKTKWRKVPKYTTKEVPNGYRTIERAKPVYAWVEKVVGYETVEKRVPRMVEKQVQVGIRTEWGLEDVPSRNSIGKAPGLMSALSVKDPPVFDLPTWLTPIFGQTTTMTHPAQLLTIPIALLIDAILHFDNRSKYPLLRRDYARDTSRVRKQTFDISGPPPPQQDPDKDPLEEYEILQVLLSKKSFTIFKILVALGGISQIVSNSTRQTAKEELEELQEEMLNLRKGPNEHVEKASIIPKSTPLPPHNAQPTPKPNPTPDGIDTRDGSYPASSIVGTEDEKLPTPNPERGTNNPSPSTIPVPTP